MKDWIGVVPALMVSSVVALIMHFVYLDFFGNPRQLVWVTLLVQAGVAGIVYYLCRQAAEQITLQLEGRRQATDKLVKDAVQAISKASEIQANKVTQAIADGSRSIRQDVGDLKELYAKDMEYVRFGIDSYYQLLNKIGDASAERSKLTQNALEEQLTALRKSIAAQTAELDRMLEKHSGQLSRQLPQQLTEAMRHGIKQGLDPVLVEFDRSQKTAPALFEQNVKLLLGKYGEYATSLLSRIDQIKQTDQKQVELLERTANTLHGEMQALQALAAATKELYAEMSAVNENDLKLIRDIEELAQRELSAVNERKKG